MAGLLSYTNNSMCCEIKSLNIRDFIGRTHVARTSVNHIYTLELFVAQKAIYQDARERVFWLGRPLSNRRSRARSRDNGGQSIGELFNTSKLRALVFLPLLGFLNVATLGVRIAFVCVVFDVPYTSCS